MRVTVGFINEKGKRRGRSTRKIKRLKGGLEQTLENTQGGTPAKKKLGSSHRENFKGARRRRKEKGGERKGNT